MNIEAATSLNFRTIKPAFSLLPWVQFYFSMTRPTSDPTAPLRNLHPDGGSTLLFDFSNKPKIGVTINLHRSRQQRRLTQPLDCLAVRFRPGAVFALLGLPADTICNDGKRPLAEHQAVRSLLDELAYLSTSAERLTAIEAFLIAQAQRRHVRPGIVQDWLDALPTAPREIRNQLADKGVSRRKLERTFRLETGFSPGELYNLHRLKETRNLLVEAPRVPLTEVAQRYGFYDQAHLIHQFTTATGETPGQYRQRKLSQFYNFR